MSYLIKRENHSKYYKVVVVEYSEQGIFNNPFQAINSAFKEKRLWQEENTDRVRLLIDNQILTNQQAEMWAKEEYQLLLKCSQCATLISENFVTHELSDHCFCSDKCANQDFLLQEEKLNSLEEIDL